MATSSRLPIVNTVSRRQFLQLTGGATALLLLNACVAAQPTVQTPGQSAAPAADQPRRGGVLRVAFASSIMNLDPSLSVDEVDLELGFNTYENLVTLAAQEAGAPLYPELAESWEMSKDARTYTFHLRKGVTFHHGTPFTAKDVVYTMTRLRDPNLGLSLGVTLQNVDTVTAVDDHTVTFQLKTPDVTLPVILGGQSMQIVPHDRTPEQLAKETSGTGPFYLAEHVPGERAVLKRRENYWNKDAIYLDEVHLLTLPEVAAQISALSGGTVDLLYQIGIGDVAALEKAPGVAILESKESVCPFFEMRVAEKPFDDVRVRQAFKHAVDRQTLFKAVMHGHGMISNDQPVAPGTPFWADLKPLEYNVETAKKLLAEAGYPDGLEVTLSTNIPEGAGKNDAGVILQEMFKAAGITLKLEVVSTDVFVAEKYMKAPFFSTWWPIPSEPNGILPLFFSKGGAYNESGWSDPKADELMAKASGEQDMAERKKLYAEVQQIISEQGGSLVPYVAPFMQAARTSLKGYLPAVHLRTKSVWMAQE
ncbi:MAG: ABC transporter substrate-binding protein [Caldilineaceae bacterium]